MSRVKRLTASMVRGLLRFERLLGRGVWAAVTVGLEEACLTCLARCLR